jgi:lysophospholipase L1-like esterase
MLRRALSIIIASALIAAPLNAASPVYVPLIVEWWGDSLVSGNQDGSGITAPSAMAALYSPTANVINGGVGGQTCSQVLTRLQASGSALSYWTVWWAGRNDLPNSSTIITCAANAVAALGTTNYIITAVLNAEGDPSGSANYNAAVAVNASYASTYGAKFVDVRSKLVAAYNPENPVDVIDHANDIPPFSLRAITFNGTIGALGTTGCPVLSGSGSTNVATNFILTVGAEYIYVTGGSAGVISTCTRGYAGTIAASYSNGQPATGTDPIHQSGAGGDTLVAGWVNTAANANGWPSH